MTYLIIKQIKYLGTSVPDTFTVVNQSEDKATIDKYLSAYKTLKREDEDFSIVEFPKIKEETVVVKKDNNFDFNQLELPFGVSSI